MGNYKATYNGTVNTEGMFERYGFAYMVMMNEVAIKQWDLATPSLIGMIENEEITKILISNETETFVQEAKIIRIEGEQFLFADLSNYPQEDKMIMTAYDDNGEVISSIQD